MRPAVLGVLAIAVLVAGGCGYTTRPGLPTHLKTVYVTPFENKINFTDLSRRDNRFPIYRPGMEIEITNAVVGRYQFTGLLRPTNPDQADARLEGELVAFHRDPLRYDPSSRVEEWRLNVIVRLKFTDLTTGEVMWEEPYFVGDATYFASGANAESEETALNRAITDLARRVIERSVENW